MLTLFIFIAILSLLIVVHEFGHFILAKKIGVRVEKFSLGFGRQLLMKKKNGTEYSLNAIPLGGYVKLAGDNLEEYKGMADEYFSQSPGRRFWIILFGPLLNYLLAFVCFWLVFSLGYPSPKVASLIDGFGAKEAGVAVGDKIIAVDGKRIYFWEELQNVINRRKINETVRLTLLRNNQEHLLEVKIKEKQLEGVSGQKINIGLIGITPQIEHTPSESLLLGLDKIYGVTLMTYEAIWRMLTGQASMREATGPVGIFYLTSKVAHLGLIALLNFIGLISLGLAVFNLLPLPLLDGGHILFLGIERIRGKTLRPKTERLLTQIGFTILISLVIVVTYNDVVRFYGDKIIKFFNRQ